MCETIGLPRIAKNTVSNDDIDNMVKSFCKEKIENDMEGSSKVKDLVGETFERKEYFESKVVKQVRSMFSFRSHMYPCKLNFAHDPKFEHELWVCDSCQSEIDSQSHVMICPAYKQLRQGKDIFNNKDVAKYLVKVELIREKLGFRK